jgi:hypothetical protein
MMYISVTIVVICLLNLSFALWMPTIPNPDRLALKYHLEFLLTMEMIIKVYPELKEEVLKVYLELKEEEALKVEP